MPGLGTFEVGIVSGIGLGCVYAMVAISYNLVLASSGVFNLGQNGLMSGAVILSFILAQRMGYSPIVTVLIVIALGAIAGSLSELIAVRVFLRRGGVLAEETLVSTLGLGLIMTAIAGLLFGGDIHPVQSYVSAAPIVVAGIPLQPIYLIMLVSAASVGIALELVLRYTDLGLMTRAIIASPEGASLLGISVIAVVQGAFVAAGAMGALASFLIAPITSASTSAGDSVALFGFAALAIGGFGSFRGALLGGVVVGLVSAQAQVFIDPVWARPIIFALILIILALRPAGLFGKAGMFGARASREV
jgi:branched-chain amino acid transport system permease protein